MSTYPEALKQLRAATTVIRQTRAGAALRAAWAAALEMVEADVLREWNETNAKRRLAAVDAEEKR